MQKKRRNGRASTKTSIEDEIAHLRGLDLGGLRARWQGVFRRPAPSHLTRHLLFAVIAYRLQADRFGDLDHATLQVLDGTAAKEAGPAMSARLASFDQKRTELTPGTVLVREWDRQSQRVMVLADGFAWNGQTYDSLSKVALAITGKRKGLWVGGTLPFGYEMKDGKIAIVEEEAELVRLIFRRYLELGSVNELLRDLKERNIRTKTRQLSTGAARGGIPFGRGALYYVLSNHFYIGEVKYKNEILPGEQPPIMDRALFESVRQKSLAQWSHRTIVRNKSDHLLTGLLFDDAGYRMIPTHATKAGIRYRYYVSTPILHGEAKTASAGSVCRVPAADIEDVVVKFLKEHPAAKQDKSITSAMLSGDRGDLVQRIAGIVVHKNKLVVRFKSDNADEASDSPDDHSVTIPWQKPPSKRSRQILLPHNASRSDVRPEQFERRARLVSAIARGRRWLDDVVSGRVTTVKDLCTRENCSVRQVNMTISLAFLAPNLVKAAVEGRLPRGIGIERLRDMSTEWSRQFEALGLNPE